MINYIIPLIVSWLPIWNNYIIFFFALAFLAWVPVFIMSFVRR